MEHNQKVLVLLTDMTSYADALAIVSNRMDQIPSKDSMPGSLYSDLAKIYEKAVQFPAGGSITIIAVILRMPFLITRVISLKVSCSYVAIVISVRLSWTRSVRCLV